MTWVTECKLDDIERKNAIRFDHDGCTYAIYRAPDDRIYCTAGLCTHEAVHLSDGLVMDFEVECEALGHRVNADEQSEAGPSR